MSTNKLIIILLFIVVYPISSFCEARIYEVNRMFTILVPNGLELRHDNDPYTRTLKDTLHVVSNAEIVFQQKGLTQKKQTAYAHYCRVMIQTDSDVVNTFPGPYDSIYTEEYLNELASSANQELAGDQRFVINPVASVKTNSNGYKYIAVEYTRSGIYGDVKVAINYFYNGKYATKILTSYKSSETNLWGKDVQDIVESMNWCNPEVNKELSAWEVAYKSTSKLELICVGIICFLLIITLVIIYVRSERKQDERKKQETKMLREDSIHSAEILLQRGKYNSVKKVISDLRKTCTEPEEIEEIDAISEELQCKKVKLQERATQGIEKIHKELGLGNVDAVQDLLERWTNDPEIPAEIKNIYLSERKHFETCYEKGIVPEQKEVRVNYDLSPCEDTNNYCFYKAPKEGDIVFPYRRQRVELRGSSESKFECKLKDVFCSLANYQVLGDVSIMPAEGYHPYEPDIAIVEANPKFGLSVDIEIDEPYGGVSKKPIHYIGCGDDFRDRNINNLGWIVFRFSERQIVQESDRCIMYITKILHEIDSEIPIRYTIGLPNPDARWSMAEAQKMVIGKYREHILGIQNFRHEEKGITTILPQTDKERELAKQIKPIKISHSTPSNIDHSTTTFIPDSKISFEPFEHIYLYDGKLRLKAISEVIGDYFTPFDIVYQATRIAREEGVDPKLKLEEWDCEGQKSRELGTFLHQQIENYFHGRAVKTEYHFVYDGEYKPVDKLIPIKKELNFFYNFLDDNPINPFRTEWHIYDLSLKIAGTIDLLCKNGSQYDIYDWKRSRKASLDEDNWGKTGINGLEYVPDIKFYHYALQQNMYKYILEQNYGITVGSMYLVVLHPELDTYIKYRIPDMKEAVNHIISNLN